MDGKKESRKREPANVQIEKVEKYKHFSLTCTI